MRRRFGKSTRQEIENFYETNTTTTSIVVGGLHGHHYSNTASSVLQRPAARNIHFGFPIQVALAMRKCPLCKNNWAGVSSLKEIGILPMALRFTIPMETSSEDASIIQPPAKPITSGRQEECSPHGNSGN
jgi:hypothetical protein